MIILLLFVAALIVGFLWCRIYDSQIPSQGFPLTPRVDIDAMARPLEGIHGGELLIHIHAPPL
jgi:hypothetical protein